MRLLHIVRHRTAASAKCILGFIAIASTYEPPPMHAWWNGEIEHASRTLPGFTTVLNRVRLRPASSCKTRPSCEIHAYTTTDQSQRDDVIRMYGVTMTMGFPLKFPPSFLTLMLEFICKQLHWSSSSCLVEQQHRYSSVTKLFRFCQNLQNVVIFAIQLHSLPHHRYTKWGFNKGYKP